VTKLKTLGHVREIIHCDVNGRAYHAVRYVLHRTYRRSGQADASPSGKPWPFPCLSRFYSALPVVFAARSASRPTSPSGKRSRVFASNPNSDVFDHDPGSTTTALDWIQITIQASLSPRGNACESPSLAPPGLASATIGSSELQQCTGCVLLAAIAVAEFMLPTGSSMKSV
jgi:hypothetical protein